eukprot:gnl/TRDRNA2_/TRDRNA2_199548_c0_seq1.p3 gnl/TRDRNA2_/TRDRNA2_199548_c0~~gnl/TRDRNA2_/TRDRNA2_199548_c0_seq1.p3  ORF type:complete len:104 (-),score=4.41 gnl/TRDRNA2_/TRDRNA2_199548_c0_seq1:302-613(-)
MTKQLNMSTTEKAAAISMRAYFVVSSVCGVLVPFNFSTHLNDEGPGCNHRRDAFILWLLMPTKARMWIASGFRAANSAVMHVGLRKVPFGCKPLAAFAVPAKH